MVRITPTWIGLEAVRLKALRAAPQILAQNRALVTAVLEQTKALTATATPIGPGHFGYHGRDTLKVEVTSRGVRTIGKLKGAVQLYWREYGTRAHFHGGRSKRMAVAIMTGQIAAGSGERAFMTAHKSLGLYKRALALYYNGSARWWR